jgi:hypothetical protein
MTEKTMHKILLPLPVELWEKIKAEAAGERRTVSNWIWNELDEVIRESDKWRLKNENRTKD